MSWLAALYLMSINKDHCKSVEDIMSAGIDCYMSEGTAEKLKIKNHRLKKIKSQFKIKSWYINPFAVHHDAAEPLGFLFQCVQGDKLVYITDTMYVKYKFNNLNYIMVECNYSMEILQKNVDKGIIPQSHKNRVIKTHFGLENVKDFLRANDLSNVKEIWLLHLSDTNSNEDQFKEEMQKLTGKAVYVA